MFYAGYNHMMTEVAAFNTKAERDAWVSNESFVERTALKSADVRVLVGNIAKARKEVDAENGCVWLS